MSVSTPHDAVGATKINKSRSSDRPKRTRKSKKAVETRALEFRLPDSVEHILAPTDTLRHVLIHYGTTAAAVRSLNPGKSDATLMFGEAVVVPWPKPLAGREERDNPPCMSCTTHGWCMAIRDAAVTQHAPVLPSSMADLEQAALNKVALMLVDSAGNSVTYSRVKARLRDEFGEDLVDRIKPRVREMLREAAEETDRLSEPSTPSLSDLDASHNSGSSEPSWAHTCLFEPSGSDGTVDSAAEQTSPDPADEDDGITDVGALQDELDHWETQLDRMQSAEDEEQETLVICMRAKVDALRNELRQRDALLGKPFKGYLASLDAKFAAAREQASVTTAASGTENACSCCGVIIRPGGAVPEGCTYRSTVGTHFPATMGGAAPERKGSIAITTTSIEMIQQHSEANDELFAL